MIKWSCFVILHLGRPLETLGLAYAHTQKPVCIVGGCYAYFVCLIGPNRHRRRAEAEKNISSQSENPSCRGFFSIIRYAHIYALHPSLPCSRAPTASCRCGKSQSMCIPDIYCHVRPRLTILLAFVHFGTSKSTNQACVLQNCMFYEKQNTIVSKQSPQPDGKKPKETRHTGHHSKRAQGNAHAAAVEQGDVKRTAGTSGKIVGSGGGGVQRKGRGVTRAGSPKRLGPSNESPSRGAKGEGGVHTNERKLMGFNEKVSADPELQIDVKVERGDSAFTSEQSLRMSTTFCFE